MTHQNYKLNPENNKYECSCCHSPSPSKGCEHDNFNSWIKKDSNHKPDKPSYTHIGKTISEDCPFCPAPKEKEDRTPEEIGQKIWQEYELMISMDIPPSKAAMRLHELWFYEFTSSRPSKQESEAVGNLIEEAKKVWPWCLGTHGHKPNNWDEFQSALSALEKVRGGK